MPEFLNNPNFIYKYVPFNVFSLKLLIDGELWFGEPNNLNDPYEGEFILENLSQVPEDKLLEMKKELNPDTHSSWFKHIYDSTGIRNFEREYSDLLKNQLRSLYGITSFSKIYNEILLWTHYSDSHKGLCFVFDKEELVQNFRSEHADIVIMDANYQSEIPRIHLDINDDILSIDGYEVFNFKIINFEYEKEIRLIKYFNPKRKESRAVGFKKSSIKAVIFGERMQNSDRRTIANILKTKKEYTDVRFFQSTKNIVTRDVRIEPVNGDGLLEIFKDFGITKGIYGDIKVPKGFKY